ncbi:MAG TPA: hypothetical protein V6D16_08235 [Candidatus Obscuribacterales bacterium]
MKTACESGLKVLTWFLGNAQVDENQALELIQQWWAELPGKTVLWQVFIEPLNFTPLFSCYYQIQDAKAQNFEFLWRREGLETWSSFTAKELTLNCQQQQLEVRPHAISNYRYQLTVVALP